MATTAASAHATFPQRMRRRRLDGSGSMPGEGACPGHSAHAIVRRPPLKRAFAPSAAFSTMALVYDLMLLLDTAATDAQRAKILADTEAAITAEGTLVGKHDWGARALAYEIRHKGEAEYHLFQFNATPALLERLHRTLRLTDGIVRFRIIKLAPGTPDPPTVRPEPPRAAEGEAPPVEAEAAPAEAAPAEAPVEAPAPAEPASAPEPEGADTEEAPAPAAE
jgi:small subunit ribosomal protein S6